MSTIGNDNLPTNDNVSSERHIKTTSCTKLHTWHLFWSGSKTGYLLMVNKLAYMRNSWFEKLSLSRVVFLCSWEMQRKKHHVVGFHAKPLREKGRPVLLLFCCAYLARYVTTSRNRSLFFSTPSHSFNSWLYSLFFISCQDYGNARRRHVDSQSSLKSKSAMAIQQLLDHGLDRIRVKELLVCIE